MALEAVILYSETFSQLTEGFCCLLAARNRGRRSQATLSAISDNHSKTNKSKIEADSRFRFMDSELSSEVNDDGVTIDRHIWKERIIAGRQSTRKYVKGVRQSGDQIWLLGAIFPK